MQSAVSPFGNWIHTYLPYKTGCLFEVKRWETIRGNKSKYFLKPHIMGFNLSNYFLAGYTFGD